MTQLTTSDSSTKKRLIAFAEAGLFIICFTAFLFRGCAVDERRAITAAEAAGYQDVHIQNRISFFPNLTAGCGHSDAVGFESSALNPRRRRVDLEICCGLFMGCTMRH